MTISICHYLYLVVWLCFGTSLHFHAQMGKAYGEKSSSRTPSQDKTNVDYDKHHMNSVRRRVKRGSWGCKIAHTAAINRLKQSK